MIKNHDRSGWFGASDTSIIMGNWNTKTFQKWWLVKMGIIQDHFTNVYMDTGNLMEIPIIHAIESIENRKIKLGNHPIYIPRYRIRANYDGLSDTLIEIKTTKNMFDKIPKNYRQQCQVLMFSTRRKVADLYAYKLTEHDYKSPYYPIIDASRLKKFEINYDEGFIKNEYIPRVVILAKALRRREFPKI